MIRVVLYLLIVGLLAFGAVWLADRPGEVVITWQGRRVDTSVMVLMMTVAAVAVLAVMLWSAVRAIVRSPGLIARYIDTRRGVRGYRAVSQGLVAVGSGDARAARKFTDEAKRIAPHEPLTLLLSAQTAQLSGDREAAASTFQQMAGRDDTKLLGLHGLFIEARRRGDPAAALLYAEEAAKQASIPPWAGQAVLEFRCVASDWSGALERLERNHKGGLVDKTEYRRQRAVLLTAQALALEDGDRDRAKAFVLEAVKLAPTLVPAAALAGRMLGEAGEARKAARIIEAAWVWNPHPDLADGYAHLRPGDSARERLARVQSLAAKSPGHVEAALAVARTAIDARELAVARQSLEPLLEKPTRRVAALMAVLEQVQGDDGRAREWMTRALNAQRDPAWTADGFVSDRWLPVSPVTGRIDAFEWKDPLAGMQDAGTLIEAEQRAFLDAPHERAPPRSPPPDAPPVIEERVQEEVREVRENRPQDDRPDGRGEEKAIGTTSRAERSAQVSSPPEESRLQRARGLPPVPLAPAVIPLAHAPDDPGPDPELHHIEPVPEATAEPPADSWSKIRQLFRP
jgi:HemY protein